MDVSCDNNPSDVSAVIPYFRNLSLAINRTGRVMDINACTGQGIFAAPELGPSFADSARIAMDAYLDANWRATIYNAGTLAGSRPWIMARYGYGRWNAREVGVKVVCPDRDQAQSASAASRVEHPRRLCIAYRCLCMA